MESVRMRMAFFAAAMGLALLAPSGPAAAQLCEDADGSFAEDYFDAIEDAADAFDAMFEFQENVSACQKGCRDTGKGCQRAAKTAVRGAAEAESTVSKVVARGCKTSTDRRNCEQAAKSASRDARSCLALLRQDLRTDCLNETLACIAACDMMTVE